MSIRFKFRSSVNFDTIEIDGGKPYVSVREFRSKILRQLKINGVCHKHFDLVFFDHLTGQEYNDDEFMIPSGSSVTIKRIPAKPVLRPHKPEASELCEDVTKGMDHNKPAEIVLENNLACEDREQIKLEKVVNSKSIDMQKVDLPSELRCPIYVTYFKEAVMIPCCQHSFCKKCICEVLQLTSRCPKCSSTKFRVEHLLPNLSLSHAIEHFIESQILATSPEIDLQKYVPDGESGIQGKEISTVTKRKLDMVYSTSADSQGENQPVMPQVCMPDEADSTSRKRRPWVSFGGGDQSYVVENTIQKSGRTCYMCGSPGHFIRDCPMASTEHLMFHTGMSGYPVPYWNPAAFSHVNPYMTMYGSPMMVPFNPTMVPVTPYAVPPYVPSTYGSQVKYFHEKRQSSSDYEDNGIQKRHAYHEPERSSEYKSYRDRGNAPSNSDGSHGRKLLKRYEKCSNGSNHTERSVSGIEDVHSGNSRLDETRHRKHRESSRRYHNSRGQPDSSHHHNKRKRRY
ncbi:uncharacterized protein LOC143589301 isoform X2 [Bidens hawaiensis]|uniref:uncharacterized protein LOC143589301 isoform X2 n=1 Tax=Bidens hawaiensis TaxID=980011 RepID=UPI00404934AB